MVTDARRFRIFSQLLVAYLAIQISACSEQSLAPAGINGSPRGVAVVKALRDASHVRMKGYESGELFTCDLSDEAKGDLLTWLSAAKQDPNPLKYQVFVELSIDTATHEWLVLSINDRELGLRAEGDNYWRGLDRLEFERILKKCRDAAAAADSGKPRQLTTDQ